MSKQTKRQEEIIDTAIKIIDSKGIQGLTIKNLSKNIGVTEGAIYRHFENKREILISILLGFQKNMEEFHKSSYSSQKPVFDKISEILNHFRKLFEANPAIVSVIFAEEIFQNDTELSEKVSNLIKENQDFILSLIKEGKENGEVRKDLNDVMIVNSILGAFRLIVKKWKMEGFSVSLKSSLDEFLEYLKATILAQ